MSFTILCLQLSTNLNAQALIGVETWKGNTPRSESEEVKLQKISKQIVQNAILRAVQQVTQEIQQKEEGITSTNMIGLQQLGVVMLTKKHEKKLRGYPDLP
ncbi:A-kinase anchor protein inhibitor 1 [Gracilinanus agilis]|uniref:A-kinase anchor protein inhibitor 1 n=1 Tax=Gracilinanus agilis TaxID=191870 RepID=UPI001CFE1FB8|nr:A-kinase anchor protein inhibitor 1 [Gracilinanus agilis]